MKFAFCLSRSWQTRFPISVLHIASWNLASLQHYALSLATRLDSVCRGMKLSACLKLRSRLFPPAEFATLQQSVATMADLLDEACHMSTDPQEGPSITVITESSTGRRGRPKKQIDPAFLQEALSLRGPSGVASVLNCHPRTVRRAALDQGIATPGVPVYVNE
ncbi:hypothetical protein R3P38DRAFT_2649508, partial [Favolaschia claudopus]